MIAKRSNKLSLVGLSELNINLFDKLSNYINKHYHIDCESQLQNSARSLYHNDILPSSSTSLNTDLGDASERIVNKLVQQQKILSAKEISEIVNAYESGLPCVKVGKLIGADAKLF